MRLPAGQALRVADDARAVLAEVDQLTAEVRSAQDTHRRDPDERWLRERLEDALVGARTVTGELLGQVEQLEQYALSHRQWDLETRLRAVVGADRVDAEPAAAHSVTELCGHLPLAPRVAANWAATLLEEARAGLRDGRSNAAHGDSSRTPRGRHG